MKKKAPAQFSRFSQKKSNAAIKEQFKQEKRKIKKDREEYFDKKRSEVKNLKQDARGQKPETGSKKPEIKGRPSGLRPQSSGSMPLNKFIAHCGICSRRDAADLVKQGKVHVNGQPVSDPGIKVSEIDDIKLNGKKIHLEKQLIYILLNKPKDFLTTTDDPQGRKTVLDIIKRATQERVYPVGRLDRNTSGVLLITNDGELAQRLTHPKNEIKKVYHITLNKPLTKTDFDQIIKGVVLEDGPALVDALAYADVKDKTQIGLEIHSGRNRIVRRIFEHLKYDVKNLDRVLFAGLTKKNVDRGKWRFLSEKEVRDLKYFDKGKRK